MAAASISIQIVPDHVPADLVWDHDYEAFASEDRDPFRRVGQLHSGPDILWARVIDRRNSGWIPTRNVLIREVLTDHEHFSSEHGQFMAAIGRDWKLIPLEYDPPQQQLYRKALEPFFSPSNVNALDGAVRKACDELIAGFKDENSCEFVGEFAERFPSYIFLDLMGMPRERLADFLAWERGMLRPASAAQQVAAMTSILAYLEEFVREQTRKPTSDLMKGIVSARYNNERPLTDTEMLSVCYLMYIGGLDTVYSTLSWIFWYLAHDLALQNRLRENPSDMTAAIEELLRAFSAASSQRRVVKDLDFHGVRMRAGDRVLTSLPLAGRDPQAYDDPHTVDIERPARHIAFGTGPHTCLGLRLAKREIRIALEAFLSRYSNLRMPKGATYTFHTSNVFGIDHLPLEWDPA